MVCSFVVPHKLSPDRESAWRVACAGQQCGSQPCRRATLNSAGSECTMMQVCGHKSREGPAHWQMRACTFAQMPW